MFTLEEREILQITGFNLLYSIASLAAATLTYGIFILLFAISVPKFVSRRDAQKWSTHKMCATTAITFVLASFYWINLVIYLAKTIRAGFIDSAGKLLDVSTVNAVLGGVFTFTENETWSRQIIQIIADAVVVWRAWVLCLQRRWLMMLPCALLLGTCATTFAFLGLTSSVDGLYDYQNVDGMRLALFNAQNALSLATNVVSTSIIGSILWSIRTDFNKITNHYSKWSYVQTVMLMIIESGAVYAVFQLATIVTLPIIYDDDTPLGYFVQVVYETYFQTTAMYSTIVFLLINNLLSFETSRRTTATATTGSGMWAIESSQNDGIEGQSF